MQTTYHRMMSFQMGKSENPSIAKHLRAALSFYFDHQPEFDRLIEQSLQRADALAAAVQDSPGRRRLRTLGKLH